MAVVLILPNQPLSRPCGMKGMASRSVCESSSGCVAQLKAWVVVLLESVDGWSFISILGLFTAFVVSVMALSLPIMLQV